MARDWFARAACRPGSPLAVDPQWFDGEDLTGEGAALGICAGCPVRENCLAAAQRLGAQAYGVWGGTTEAERLRLRRAEARRAQKRRRVRLPAG